MMPWGVYEDKHLLDLIGERKSLKEIAQALSICPEVVIEKIRRLGLSIEFVNMRVELIHRARFRRRTHALASLLNHKNPRPAVIATESPLLHGNRCPHDILGQCSGVHHKTSKTVTHGKTVKV